MKFKEPINEKVLEFKLLPLSVLKAKEAQRKRSAALVKKLLSSEGQLGFVAPVLVCPLPDGTYEVLDGQHRIYALKQLRPTEDDLKIPAIVLPPEDRDQIFFPNSEKADALRDTLEKLRRLLAESSFRERTEESLWELGLLPYILVLSQADFWSPSLVEGLAKKLFGSYEEGTIEENLPLRKEQAEALKAVENAVLSIAEDYGVKDYVLKKAILSKTIQKIYGSRKPIEDDWQTAIQKILAGIADGNWAWLAR